MLLFLFHLVSSFPSSTDRESTSFMRFNAFVNMTKSATEERIKQDKAAENPYYSKNTEPSDTDLALFDRLRSMNVIFDGNSKVTYQSGDLTSLSYGINTTFWENNYVVSTWTMGFWIKASELTGTLLEMQIKDVLGRPDVKLSCGLNQTLTCFSERSDKKMTTQGLFANQWYYVVVDSQQNKHRIRMFSKEWTQTHEVRVVSKGPLSLANMNLTIGSSFKGVIKRFSLVAQVYDDINQLKPMAFSYLYAFTSSKILLEIPLDNVNQGLVEQKNIAYGTKQGNLVQLTDNDPNWNCFHMDQVDFKSFYRFQGSLQPFDRIKLSDSVYKDIGGAAGDSSTTLVMWFFREPLAFSHGESSVNRDGSIYRLSNNQADKLSQDEVLFDHEGLLKVAFYHDKNDFINITAHGHSSTSKAVQVPRGEWIWLQVSVTKLHYAVHVKNAQGRDYMTELVSHPNHTEKTSQGIKVLQGFYGFVKGLKYYKIEKQFETEYFEEQSSTDQNLLVFYRFEKQFYDTALAKGKFKSIAIWTGGDYSDLGFLTTTIEADPGNPQVTRYRLITPQPIFDTYPTVSETQPKTGLLDQTINYQGVQCSDPKKSLLLLTQTDISTPLQLQNQDAIQVSMWIKMNTTDRGSPGYIDARTRSNEIAEYDVDLFKLSAFDDKRTLMQLKIRNTTASCELFGFGKFSDQTIIYKEFDYYSTKWQHISCWFKGYDRNTQRQEIESGNQFSTSYNLLQGQLIKEGSTYNYYFDQSKLPQNVFLKEVVSGDRLQLGANLVNFSMHGPHKLRLDSDAGVFVQDLRVFNDVQTQKQWLYTLHQEQIDVQGSLVLFSPLTEGLYFQNKLFNYKTGRTLFSKNLVYLDASYQNQNPTPLRCPNFFVYSYKQNKCVRDILVNNQQLQAFVMRSKDDVNFKIMPLNLKFQEIEGFSYQRKVSYAFLKYSWRTTKIEGFAPDRENAIRAQTDQQTSYVNISTDSMNNQGMASLTVQLNVTGVGNYMTPVLNQEMQINLNPCAKLYDAKTGKSYVDVELNHQRGQQDFTFDFFVYDCASEFQLVDFSKDFKVLLMANEQNPYEAQFTRNGTKITVPGSFISYINYDSPFFVIAQAKFTSKTSHHEQLLSLVYRLRFLPNFYIQESLLKSGVPYGQEMNLYSNVSLVNKDNMSFNKTWICPAGFDCSSLNLTADVLSISDQQLHKVAQGSIQHMKKYYFSLQVRGSQALTRELPYVQKVYSVTWLGAPGTIQVDYPKQSPVSQSFNIQMVPKQGQLDGIRIKWSLESYSTSVQNKDAVFINGDTNVAFIIARNALGAGNYKAKLSLHSIEFNDIQIYEATYQFELIGSPSDGTISIDKTQGDALFYTFTILAPQWIASSTLQDKTLSYQYFYNNSEGQSVALSHLSQGLDRLQTALPPTNAISVRVTDSVGGYTQKDLAVNVRLDQTGDLYQQIIGHLAKAKTQASTEPLKAYQDLSTWAESLSLVQNQLNTTQINEIEIQVLDIMPVVLGQMNNIDYISREFIAQKTIYLQNQMTKTFSNYTADFISRQLSITNTLFKDQRTLQKVFREQNQMVQDSLSNLNIMYGAMQNVSYGLDLNSTKLNQTVEQSTGQLRASINSLDQMLSISQLPGQTVQLNQNQMFFWNTKFSKQDNLADRTYSSLDNQVKYIFPLSQLKQPSQSQSFTAVIFSNQPNKNDQDKFLQNLEQVKKNDEAYLKYQKDNNLTYSGTNLTVNDSDTLPRPDFNVQGGAFAGTTLKQQKVLANHTFYFTYRDMYGNEVFQSKKQLEKTNFIDSDTAPKVQMDFKLNLTTHIRKKFENDLHHTMRCAYHPSNQTIGFEKFLISKCDTAIIDSNNNLLFTSTKNFTKFEGGNRIVNLTNLDDGQPFIKNNTKLVQLLANQSTILFKCLCQHQSYFTLIEDYEAQKVEFDTPQNVQIIENFHDFSIVAQWSYLILLGFILLLTMRAADMEQWKNILKMEDQEIMPQLKDLNEDEKKALDDIKKEETQIPEDSLTLNNYIFWRKDKVFHHCQSLQPVDTSREWWKSGKCCSIACQSFRLFMKDVHPLFSIFYKFDIGVRRSDRVLFLIVRLFISAVITILTVGKYRFSPATSQKDLYKGLTKQQIALLPQATSSAGEQVVLTQLKQGDQKDLIIRLLVLLVVNLILLAPFPQWVFDACRTRYKLKNVHLSNFEEDENEVSDNQKEGGDGLNMNLNLDEVERQNQIHAAQDQSSIAVTPRTRKNFEIFLDQNWSIETLIKLNSLPYEQLLEFRAIFQYSFAAPEFVHALEHMELKAKQLRQSAQMLSDGNEIIQDEPIVRGSGESGIKDGDPTHRRLVMDASMQIQSQQRYDEEQDEVRIDDDDFDAIGNQNLNRSNNNYNSRERRAVERAVQRERADDSIVEEEQSSQDNGRPRRDDSIDMEGGDSRSISDAPRSNLRYSQKNEQDYLDSNQDFDESLEEEQGHNQRKSQQLSNVRISQNHFKNREDIEAQLAERQYTPEEENGEISHIEDVYGNVYEVEEIIPIWIDEARLLEPQSNNCARCMMRLIQFLIILLTLSIFFLGYYTNKSYLIDGYSSFQVSVFFGMQAVIFLILQPLFLLILSCCFANPCCCSCCCRQLKITEVEETIQDAPADQSEPEDALKTILKRQPRQLIKSFRDDSNWSGTGQYLMPQCYQNFTDLIQQAHRIAETKQEQN